MSHLHRIDGTASPAAPFDFAKTLDFLRRFPPTFGLNMVVGNCVHKAQRINGRTVLFRISARGTVQQPFLHYTVDLHKAQDLAEAEKEAIEWLRFFLGWDDDLHEFYELAEHDPYFAPIACALYGYHHVKFPSPFEAAVWAIVSQRNQATVARGMHQALLKGLGHRISRYGLDYWAFPEAQEVAPLEVSDLPTSLRPMRRGEYILDAARAFATANPAFLRSGPVNAVEDWLRGIKGIGPWSARFVLLRALGRTYVHPEDDRFVIDAASLVYGEGRRLTPLEVGTLADAYGAWKGYWAHYLWLAVRSQTD